MPANITLINVVNKTGCLILNNRIYGRNF